GGQRLRCARRARHLAGDGKGRAARDQRPARLPTAGPELLGHGQGQRRLAPDVTAARARDGRTGRREEDAAEALRERPSGDSCEPKTLRERLLGRRGRPPPLPSATPFNNAPSEKASASDPVRIRVLGIPSPKGTVRFRVPENRFRDGFSPTHLPETLSAKDPVRNRVAENGCRQPPRANSHPPQPLPPATPCEFSSSTSLPRTPPSA